MRVLVVHNRYSAATPSGENVSVDHEIEGLCAAGVDVHRHEVSNDDVLSGGWSASCGPRPRRPGRPGRGRLDAEIDRIRPDVVHVHNLFPLLTASVPARALARGLPVVWTARNLRVTCVEGTQFRAGADCRLCRPGWRVPGIRHRCYRGLARCERARHRRHVAVPPHRPHRVTTVAHRRHHAPGGWSTRPASTRPGST